jgi:hypothetical protein
MSKPSEKAENLDFEEKYKIEEIGRKIDFSIPCKL